jgi:rod shape-determining protein MreC
MSLTDKAKDRAKRNPKVLLSVLVVLHLILISLNRVPGQPDLRYLRVVATAAMTPLQWLTTHSVSLVKSGWNGYFALRGAKLENERLKARNAELETQIIELGEKAKGLNQVDSLNQSPAIAAYPHVNASVIGRSAIQWFNSIVIDRGSLYGVMKDQPVMSVEGGLVGRVIQVTSISARVLLITDERHGAGALIAPADERQSAGAIIAQTTENRLLGVLKGKNQSLCELRFVETPAKLENGEQVITSGQDQLYPKGLLIGRVRNLSGGTVAVPAVEVEPAARLEKLERVAVLQVSPAEIHRSYDELIRAEKEKEKQEKAPARPARTVGPRAR